MTINNGDVFDINQTVNSISRFLWLNGKWHYFEARHSAEYEYDQDMLTQMIEDNYGMGY